VGKAADDPARANVRETMIGPHRRSAASRRARRPEGVLDLIGNVREWTNTWADGGRVLRGGSYMDELAECRPSTRLRATDPLAGHGFRLVRSMTGR